MLKDIENHFMPDLEYSHGHWKLAMHLNIEIKA